MTAEIICVGTEILLGNIVNTNAAYMAEKIASVGIACYYQSVVGDNEERLLEAINVAMKRSDIVILSGGLGPTEDDLTKETAAKACKRKLVMDEPSRKAIEDYFAVKGTKPTENNWKQALIPEGAKAVPNPNGTAPGIIIENKNCKIILLPGPPGELIPMFESSILPYLDELTPGVIVSQTVKICGVGESSVETMIKDLIDSQTNPTIATYAKIGEVHIRVTAHAEDKKEAKKLIKPVVKELKERFGNYIYTTDDNVTLEQSVVDLLLANDLTVTAAESCTGGMFSARLINVSGVSEVYKSGYVTYSNKAKRKVLGVRKSVIDKHGVISAKTAEEMVKGLNLITRADVAVAITGNAGPVANEDKPVGLVYIACGIKGKITVTEAHFSGNRNKIRESAVTAALVLMRNCILEYYSRVTFGKNSEE